jgi:hypothetical protein
VHRVRRGDGAGVNERIEVVVERLVLDDRAPIRTGITRDITPMSNLEPAHRLAAALREAARMAADREKRESVSGTRGLGSESKVCVMSVQHKVSPAHAPDHGADAPTGISPPSISLPLHEACSRRAGA